MKKRLEVEYHTEEGLEHFIGMAGYDNIKVTVLAEQKSEFCKCEKMYGIKTTDNTCWGCGKKYNANNLYACERCKEKKTRDRMNCFQICWDCWEGRTKPKKKLEKLEPAYYCFTGPNKVSQMTIIHKINEIIDRIE